MTGPKPRARKQQETEEDLLNEAYGKRGNAFRKASAVIGRGDTGSKKKAATTADSTFGQKTRARISRFLGDKGRKP